MRRFRSASQCAIITIMEQPIPSSALTPRKPALAVPNYGPLDQHYPQWRPGVGSRRRLTQEPAGLAEPWMSTHCSRVGLRRMAPRQRSVPWLLLLVGLTAAGLASYALSGMDEARFSSTRQAQAHERTGLPESAGQDQATLAAAVPVMPDVTAQGSLQDDAPSPAAAAQSGQDPVPLAGRSAALQTSAGIASAATLIAARVATGLGSGVPAAVSSAPASAVSAEKNTAMFLTPSQTGDSVDAKRIKRPKAAPASAECNDALRAMQLCDARSAQRP